MAKYTCRFCNNEFTRSGKRIPVFCSIDCKSQWQRTQKPVTKEWLYEKYIIDKLGTYEIGKMVNRDAKRVYEWLVDYGIPTRTKHDSIVAMNKRTSTKIKRSNLATGRVWTDKQKEKLSKSRKGKHYPKLQGSGNGMFGKRGDKSSTWLGGCTPERQAFYTSREWANACSAVWKRDDAKCRRCGVSQVERKLHVHHVISFAIAEFRAEPSNLILLCSDCHMWVHSKKNINGDFINESKG